MNQVPSNETAYRGSLSNANFGSGKNLHQAKFALAKYLPYANVVFTRATKPHYISYLMFFSSIQFQKLTKEKYVKVRRQMNQVPSNETAYRGSLSNANFGSGKNLHQAKFALAKYLPYANFGLFHFISAIFLA